MNAVAEFRRNGSGCSLRRVAMHADRRAIFLFMASHILLSSPAWPDP